MGEERSRAAKCDPAQDVLERPTMPAPKLSGRYRWAANDDREAIPSSSENAVIDDERITKAKFEAIKLLRRALSGD
jgi:hypothetical protein